MTTSPYSGDDTTEAAYPPVVPADEHPVKRRELDLRNTWQIIIGAMLIPFGIAVIIIGWHGAAYSNVDQKQIPYLISGGIMGLAIVVIGCFFYWAHWLYRIQERADANHQEVLREQREMMKALIESLATGGGRYVGESAPAGVVVSANGRAVSRTFVATATGTNFHTAGCPMVANRAGALRNITEQEAEEMKPCRVCEPLVSSN